METTTKKRGRPQTEKAQVFLKMIGTPQEFGPQAGQPHTVRTAAQACGLNATYGYILAKKARAALDAKVSDPVASETQAEAQPEATTEAQAQAEQQPEPAATDAPPADAGI